MSRYKVHTLLIKRKNRNTAERFMNKPYYFNIIYNKYY